MAAETADKYNPKSVDDLFRLLVRIRGKSPIDARDEIQDALSRDQLGVDMHIAGGARRLLREATSEELKQAAEAERENRPWSWEFLYETLPPEGRITPVHYNCWRHGHILDLEIKDERLVIVPHRTFDFPWESYSFTLANWSPIEELWPRLLESKPEPKPPEPAPTRVREPANVTEPIESKVWYASYSFTLANWSPIEELWPRPLVRWSALTEPIAPKVWYDAACEANPRRADEGLVEHDWRIYRLMVEAVAAEAVTKQWSVETIGRQRRRKQGDLPH